MVQIPKTTARSISLPKCLAKLRSGDAQSTPATPGNSAKTSDQFPAVDIDTGRFKYVLIEVTDPSGDTLHLVRGHGGPGFGYHYNVANPTANKLQEAGLQYEVLGGGRIEHDATAKKILIYGGHANACICGVDSDACHVCLEAVDTCMFAV